MEKKYVFIGGLHRSGTTLLANILGQHPQISAFKNTNVHEDEGQFLQEIYKTDNYYGGPGRFSFDPKSHLTEKSEIITKENIKAISNSWKNYWDLDKTCLLEKTPSNIIQSRFLQKVFPNSYFIFLTRHPIATSIATYKWSGTGIYSLLNHWIHCHEILNADSKFINNQIFVSFEELTIDPEAVLKKILTFIDEKEFLFEFKIRKDLNANYFGKWENLFYKEKRRIKPIPQLGAVHAHKKHDFLKVKRFLKGLIRRKLFGPERQFSLSYFESQDAVCMFENRINKFGYSLLNLDKYPKN